MRSTREAAWSVVLAAALAAGLLHCVGDEPAVTGSDDDAGVTGGDGGSGGDGAVTGDGGGGATAARRTATAASTAARTTRARERPTARTRSPRLRHSSSGSAAASARRARATISRPGTISRARAATATPTTESDGGPAEPPQCGLASLNGDPVVSFGAPTGSFVDQTLAVDLAFLGGATAYSIFVVVERAADQSGGVLATNYVKPPALPCKNMSTDLEYNFTFGYIDTLDYSDVLGYTEGCADQTLTAGSYTASTPELDELFFSTTAGHSVYQNGSLETSGGSGNDLSPLQNTPGFGVIGRGSSATTDERFKGTIAEVVIFSSLLSTAERQNIENHLKKQWNLTF